MCSLKDLISSNLSLVSKGRSNVQSYTQEEEELALQIATAVLTVAGHIENKDRTSEEIYSVLKMVIEETEELSVPSLCRAVYCSIERARLTNPETVQEFPKMKNDERVQRDFTSVSLLFRKALRKLNVEEELIDQIFPSPYKKKKKSK